MDQKTERLKTELICLGLFNLKKYVTENISVHKITVPQIIDQ